MLSRCFIVLIMHVVTRKYLLLAEALYPDAGKEIRAWYKIAVNVHWKNFLEVRQVFPDADAVDGYVIFKIRQNRFRLVTIIHYARERDGRLTEGHVYIRSLLTHKQYDNRANWDKGVKP
jgi:mRNA interferase HigB